MADPTPTATRGEPTREALLRAAIDVFGRDGFDAASTRAISDAAGVNQALIGYHFGGKPGLYLAALRSIAASVSTRIGPLVESIEAYQRSSSYLTTTTVTLSRLAFSSAAAIKRPAACATSAAPVKIEAIA